MKIGIYANLARDIGGASSNALLSLLSARNHKVYLSENLGFLNTSHPLLKTEDLAKEVDLMFVFGGDGTILRVAKFCAMHNTKIFAVNMGHMGFLTEVEDIKLDESLDRIESGDYIIDKRYLLSAELNGEVGYALNEAVIERGTRTKMLRSEVRVNGALLDIYNSDGIIVSTPTGSTAYSLSAGGSIIAPDLNALIVTPICPNSLHSRPIVINSSNTIGIKVIFADKEAHLNFDSDGSYFSLKDGDEVKIKQSTIYAPFLRFKGYNYYEKLMSKMNYWSINNNTSSKKE
ncbi:MAG: NAD(+)/NADH kinase [Clostridia bacterium]